MNVHQVLVRIWELATIESIDIVAIVRLDSLASTVK